MTTDDLIYAPIKRPSRRWFCTGCSDYVLLDDLFDADRFYCAVHRGIYCPAYREWAARQRGERS